MIKLSASGYPDAVVSLLQPGTESLYIAQGYVDIPQPPSLDHRWTGSEWIAGCRNPRSLADAKCDKYAELRLACRRAIIAGFTSDALGSEHTYPSEETDQANLSSSVLASMLPGNPGNWATPFLCADAAGNWDYRAHTAVQIRKVGVDAKAAILAKLIAKAELFKTVMQAQSIEAVEAVSWA